MPERGAPSPITRTRVQAVFLHDRLIADGLNDDERHTLWADIEKRSSIGFPDRMSHVGAYENVVAHLLGDARELSIAVIEGDVENGELATLTQDFYIRRDSRERASFRAKLDSDRRTEVHGRFSTARLIGATGESEAFGHRRFTMLGYVDEVRLDTAQRRIELRPLFIGWRLAANAPSFEVIDDRREVWPQQVDQFAAVKGMRARKTDLAIVAGMPEKEVKRAFAEIIGEPFVPKDWPGETSDLFTSRVSIDGEPLSAAFAFKGPGQRGTLHVAGMGKRGDQALRLAREPADLFVVQHHAAIDAEVRNLLSAVARQHCKRFMTIDGATTAILLRAYGMLST